MIYILIGEKLLTHILQMFFFNKRTPYENAFIGLKKNHVINGPLPLISRLESSRDDLIEY